MAASMLRDAADTLTETVSDLAHTVAETTPEVTHKVGETALRLAALTPWVDEATSTRGRRRWVLALAALVALGILGWWLSNRRTGNEDAESTADTVDPGRPDRRLRAAAGS